jgi:hypothetical protein
MFVFSDLLAAPPNKERTAPECGVSILTLRKMAIVGRTLLWVGPLGKKKTNKMLKMALILIHFYI